MLTAGVQRWPSCYDRYDFNEIIILSVQGWCRKCVKLRVLLWNVSKLCAYAKVTCTFVLSLKCKTIGGFVGLAHQGPRLWSVVLQRAHFQDDFATNETFPIPLKRTLPLNFQLYKNFKHERKFCDNYTKFFSLCVIISLFSHNFQALFQLTDFLLWNHC